MSQLAPGDAGTELGHFLRKQRLSQEVVVILLIMFVSEQSARILKQRLNDWFRLARRRFGAAFIDLINTVRFGVRDDTLSSIPPGNFDGKSVAQAPSREYAQSLVAGEVAASAKHLLNLNWNRPAKYFDPGTNPKYVGSFSSQADRDARRGRIVSVNQGRTVQTVYHDVQIAIVVQVGQRHALGDFTGVEPPTVADILEGPIRSVAKG